MFFRIATLVHKELEALLRDPKGRLLLIVPVLLQLAIFPLAATLEVKNSTYGSMLFYILALVGIGFLISSICSTSNRPFSASLVS